mgnify:CR=1 FL=1
MSSSYFRPVEGNVGDIKPVKIEMVRKTSLELLWDELVRCYHYLGHQKMPGARLKYLVFSNGVPISALSFRAASLKLKPRDCFIGWSKEQREENLLKLANNNRFLILPWVRVANLGSYLLSHIIYNLEKDWYHYYGAKLLLLETFVDPRFYRGTVYRAAGWVHVGATLGFTKKGSSYRYHGHPKEVYLYPIKKDFRSIIGCVKRPFKRSCPRTSKYPERSLFKMMLTHDGWDPNLAASLNISTAEICILGQKLYDFHQQFSGCFRREEQRVISLTYLKRLASDLEAKSGEPIALRYLGQKAVRNTQHFLTTGIWDDKALQAQHQRMLAKMISGEDGMFAIDSSENPKKGGESAGVSRQYCGRLGKIANCQSGVFLGYASCKGYGLLDSKLYVPEKWFGKDYESRRKNCHFPEDLSFKTKHELALELLKKAEKTGAFAGRWVGVDSFFGANPDFLDAVGKNYYYFADIRSNTLVWLKRPKISLPPYKGRGPYPKNKRPLTDPVLVSEIAKDPLLSWKTVSIGEGAKGPIVAQVACLRVIEKRGHLPGKECWLFFRKNADGEIRYALCNGPRDMPVKEMIHMSSRRWSIEQLFKEGKSYLGMDSYEIRSYTGWHRHMSLVFLIMHFLLSVRIEFGQKKTS